MRFSIFVIEPDGYKYSHFLYDICKYLCYGIESAGHDCCILRNKFTSDRINIIIGAHNLTDPAVVEQIKRAGRYILLQSEIVTGDSVNKWPAQKSFTQVFLPLMQNAQAVWDGFESNIGQLRQFGIDAEFLRFGYHHLMEEIHHKPNKDIDFLFCGSITPHRKNLLNALIARGGNVATMFDDAAMYRNDLIARSRVNLAPNQGPGINHLGGARVFYLLNNHSMVVVERCHDQGMYEHCFPSADTEKWVDLCMETLRRPDLAQITEEYYERFKKIRMVDFIQPLLEKFFATIKSSSPVTTSIKKDNQMKTDGSINAELSLNPQYKHKDVIPGMTSIIILTYNRLEQTKKCVKSIMKHTPEPLEIIFVDNGSTDGTVTWLHGQIKENKNFQLIENKENVGFTKSRNQGMSISQGEFILLLDNDVIVSEGWLSGMREGLNRAPAAGIIGPMTNKSKGIQQIVSDEYRSVDYLDKYAVKFKEQYRYRQIPCRDIAGFCMLFKRALTEKIGLLDERFGTSHFEDEDFCIRAALEGYHNYIAGDVFIHHHGGKGSPGDRDIIEKKWTLSTTTSEGKKLLILKTTELAAVLYQREKIDQAAEALINCIKYTPDAKEIYYELARIFIESKKFPEALEVIGNMPETAKDEINGLECNGYAKEGLGLDDEAAAYADRMLAIDAKYPAALNLRGVLAYKKGDTEKAADYFQKAIKTAPAYGEAYTNLGVLYWSMDKQEEALVHLRKGFVLSPTVPDVSSLYYSVVSSLSAYTNAEADFREACRLYPNNKKLTFLHIDTLIRQGLFDAAMLSIEDALALFGLEEGTFSAALAVRKETGPLQIAKTSKKITLSLCMIVKNEEKNLFKCLKSVRDIVDEIIVVDTGSTDKTKDIATVFGAKVFDFPWTGDFSAARNHSMAQATGEWILILDADEVISARDFNELKALIHRKSSSSPTAYSIITRNYVNNVSVIGWTPKTGQYPEEAGAGWVTSAKVRLFKRRKDVFFSNPVHEILEDSLKKAKISFYPCNIIVHHYGKLDMERDTQKGEDYYLLGKIKYENDPTNLKYINELAKQAQVLGKYEESVKLWLELLSIFKADPESPGYKEIASVSYGDPVSEIYIQLASAYLMLNRYDEALPAARKAIEAKIKLKEYVHIYAHCEIIAGSLDKAFTALEELLKTTPDYPPALFMTSVIFCLEGKSQKARELFHLLRQRGVHITPTLNKTARQLHTYGKKNEALLILNATIENNLNDKETQSIFETVQNSKSKQADSLKGT